MLLHKKWIVSLILVLALLVPGISQASETASKENTDRPSKITHETFKSKTLDRDYNYNIYFPENYQTSNKRYPVLYLLHGSGGSEDDWVKSGNVKETADRLIESGAIPPSVIVMPGSKSWWVDGYNEKAETAFFNDLIPHIDKKWRTIASKEGRLVAGLSAGGYGTVNFVLKRPDMFAAGAALSPASYTPLPPSHSSAWKHATFLKPDGTFDTEKWDELNYTSYIDDYKKQDIKVPLYINSGDHDTFDIAYHAAVLYQSLREHQPELVEFRVVDGDHEWKVWSETLPEAMTYMYKFVDGPKSPGKK